VSKGTVVFYNTYLVKKQTVKVHEKKPDQMTDDEKEEMKTHRKPVLREEKKLMYNDLAMIPVRLEEFFIDDNARVFKGSHNEAIDCGWETYMTRSQIENEFGDSDDPFILKGNLKKIKDHGDASEDTSFFQPPKGLKANQFVVARYWNKYIDEYIIIIDDIIIRDGPNNSPDKELPFEVKACFPFLDNPYGISFPAILEGLQSEDETLRNMYLDQIKLIVRPPMKISQRLYGDIVDLYDRVEPGMMLPVMDEGDISWMQRSQPVHEAERMRASIRDDSVIATGIDPRRQGLSQPNATATDALLNKEATQKIMKRILKRYLKFLGGCWGQLYHYLSLDYSIEDIRGMTDVEEGSTTEKIMRKIRVHNKKFSINGDEELESNEIKGYSSLELKQDYFEFEGKPSIYISAMDALETSKGLEMRKWEQTLQDFLPLAGDPTQTPAGEPQMPVDINVLLRGYQTSHTLPEELITSDSVNLDAVIKKAIEQNQEMQQGKYVAGIPGEAIAHQLAHQVELQTVNQMLQAPGQIPFNEVQILKTYQILLAKHLLVDNQPRGFKMTATIQDAAPQQPGAGQLGAGPQGPAQSGPTNGMAGGIASQPGSPLGGTQGPSMGDVNSGATPQPQLQTF